MHALFGTLLTRFIAKMGVTIVVVEINEKDVNFPEISFSFSDAWPRRHRRMVRLIFPNAMRRKSVRHSALLNRKLISLLRMMFRPSNLLIDVFVSPILRQFGSK